MKVHLSSLALHNNTSKRVEMKIAGKREGVLVLDFYATNWMEQMAMTVGPVVGRKWSRVFDRISLISLILQL